MSPWVLCLVPVVLVEDLDVLGEAQRFLKKHGLFLILRYIMNFTPEFCRFTASEIQVCAPNPELIL